MQKTATRTSSKVKTGVVVGLLAVAVVAAGFVFLLSRIVPIFALSSSSPAGLSVPGFNEVFRYSIEAQSINIEMSGILFEINTTDNSGTGWNTCDQLGEMSKWAIYDNGGNRIDATGGWIFYNSDMIQCTGSEVVRYARTALPGMSPVPSGSTHIFSLHIDTVGASESYDDSIVASIPGIITAIEWNDSRGIVRGARGVTSLPVRGGTIIY